MQPMLPAARLNSYQIFLYRNLSRLDMEQFINQRVVVKGCGDRAVPEAAFCSNNTQLSKVARVVCMASLVQPVPYSKTYLT